MPESFALPHAANPINQTTRSVGRDVFIAYGTRELSRLTPR
jgi:hypothetical protein